MKMKRMVGGCTWRASTSTLSMVEDSASMGEAVAMAAKRVARMYVAFILMIRREL